MDHTERRLRAMETAFERERQQRDLLEKKYARLKRRYVRLERSHNRLLLESQGAEKAMKTPEAQSEVQDSVGSTASSRPFAVIDLTSPRADISPTVASTNGSVVGVSRGMRNLQHNFSVDEICGESPSSSPESARDFCSSLEREEEKESVADDSWRHCTTTTSVSRRRPHTDFALPPGLTDSRRALASPPRRTQVYEPHSDHSISSHSSPQSTHSMTTHTGESRTRTRPRLYLHEQTAAHAYGYELEQELEPREHRHERYRWVSDPSPEPSTPSRVVYSPTNSSSLPPSVATPASRPRAQSNEEASLALARYLQQEENIAAYEEYESIERAHQSTGSLLSGLISHQRNIDPDNMTYEELLRLGEEVGDVKKERWRQAAVQVLSSLPTHCWTRSHGEDTCIICQYDFMPNDHALTLPCAHVFHEDCVGGWIRENNSCPLCKREITSIY